MTWGLLPSTEVVPAAIFIAVVTPHSPSRARLGAVEQGCLSWHTPAQTGQQTCVMVLLLDQPVCHAATLDSCPVPMGPRLSRVELLVPGHPLQAPVSLKPVSACLSSSASLL